MKTAQNRWVFIIDVAMFGLMLAIAFYMFSRTGYSGLKTVVVVGIGIGVLVYILRNLVSVERVAKPQTQTQRKRIAKLILMDEEGESIKEWYIEGETSLLIGKTTARSEADIDLAGTDYASLVSVEHAVLNRVNSDWFVEDVDSGNGTGLRPANESVTKKLESGEPYRIYTGDLLYIANTRLLVK
ncbi:FHA domain-containing protein [Paenibacillus sp. FSL R10-2782]|uniref:FHA domain-containing protein n=1 Tax=Paenibacillus sp. FSL R10-2782 TaxID=2954661 RepID=UPI003159362B